jgi:hypothetical protein
MASASSNKASMRLIEAFVEEVTEGAQSVKGGRRFRSEVFCSQGSLEATCCIYFFLAQLKHKLNLLPSRTSPQAKAPQRRPAPPAKRYRGILTQTALGAIKTPGRPISAHGNKDYIRPE